MANTEPTIILILKPEIKKQLWEQRFNIQRNLFMQHITHGARKRERP